MRRATWQATDHRLRDSGGFSWMSSAAACGLSFLTLVSGMAVYLAKGDRTTIAFVATSYLDLVLLCCCLWFYGKAEPGSPRRNRLKASVWALTTLLTFSFAYVTMETAGLTLPVALLVWTTAAATGVGAYSAFFQQDRINQMLDEAKPQKRPPI